MGDFMDFCDGLSRLAEMVAHDHDDRAHVLKLHEMWNCYFRHLLQFDNRVLKDHADLVECVLDTHSLNAAADLAASEMLPIDRRERHKDNRRRAFVYCIGENKLA